MTGTTRLDGVVDLGRQPIVLVLGGAVTWGAVMRAEYLALAARYGCKTDPVPQSLTRLHLDILLCCLDFGSS